MKSTKNLVNDSIFSAIVVLFHLLFNLYIINLNTLISLLSFSLIASYFYNKSLLRQLFISLIIVFFGFMFHTINIFLFNVIPTIIIGNILTYFFKIDKNIVYFLIAIICFAFFEIVTVIVKVYFYFSSNIFEYLNEIIENSSFLKIFEKHYFLLGIVFILSILFISFLKASIAKKIFKFYKLRLSKIIERE